jgi:hypothetical protein
MDMHRVLRSIPTALLLAAAAAGLSACGSSIQFVREDSYRYPARDQYAQVEVYQGSVMTPHVVIGTLSAHRTLDANFNDRSTYDDIVAQLKDYARKVGADALTEVHPVATETGGMKSKISVTAKAVRYLEAGATLRSKES